MFSLEEPPNANAALQNSYFCAHSLSLFYLNPIPGSQRGERLDLNEHRVVQGARDSRAEVLVGTAAGCCDSKCLFLCHFCSCLEHSKIGSGGGTWRCAFC